MLNRSFYSEVGLSAVQVMKHAVPSPIRNKATVGVFSVDSLYQLFLDSNVTK